MSEHAPLAPSSAARWVNCPGSVRMEAAYPVPEETPEQREGTAAHWAVEQVLRGQVVAEGHIAPNGCVLDVDMVDGAELMRSSIPPGVAPLLRIEQRVSMAERIHPDCWGTPDVYAYDPRTRVVHLYDYKYGRGYVEVIENFQLIAYGAGVLATLGLHDLDVTFEFVIVQPRCWHPSGNVRRWRIAASYLRAQWNRLQMAAEAAMGDDPPLNPGTHCEHCRARVGCVANHRHVSRLFDYAERALPVEMPDNALAFALRELIELEKLLKARRIALEEDAASRLRAGRRLPGFALESKAGAREWTADAQTVIGFGRMYGLDLAKAPEPITPTQALKKGLPAYIVENASRRPDGAAKLVQSDPHEMRRMFGS